MIPSRSIAILVLVCGCSAPQPRTDETDAAPLAAAATPSRIPVLIIDGVNNHAADCVGFQTVLARGAEYVATGEVTIGVPAAFPGSDESSVVAPELLEWPM
jgi:hypothetical protein